MLLLLELQLADLQDGTQLTCAQLFNDWESWAALNRDAISSMVFSEPRGSLGPALFTVRFDWPKALEACAEGDLIDTDSYATNVNNAFSLVQTALAVDTSLD